MEVCREGIVGEGGKQDASVFGAFNISNNIFGSADMGWSGIGGIFAKDGSYSSKIRTGSI